MMACSCEPCGWDGWWQRYRQPGCRNQRNTKAGGGRRRRLFCLSGEMKSGTFEVPDVRRFSFHWSWLLYRPPAWNAVLAHPLHRPQRRATRRGKGREVSCEAQHTVKQRLFVFTSLAEGGGSQPPFFRCPCVALFCISS
ncbi:hypothetical protein ABL78_8464 [Leptomonas seymouri]|uniref:Uncharacterized protein n=1 Tax=Leptomonas seymouri TaxID=5684 RepID=A0A0N0P245_LEPSE|nr:hypothetical protein ABL78_8464 [Leptomonas seymouri]|eukprot:KPI82526.1 hypothetical protein ABL78_8464 [Leptomonas seymouri]